MELQAQEKHPARGLSSLHTRSRLVPGIDAQTATDCGAAGVGSNALMIARTLTMHSIRGGLKLSFHSCG